MDTVFKGDVFGRTGTKLKFVSGAEYVKNYNQVQITDEVRRLAEEATFAARWARPVWGFRG